MDGEKRNIYPGESSQEKYCNIGCWLRSNNRIHAEGSSAPAPELVKAYRGPGWRFQPTDFEMVKYLLPWKLSNQQIPYAPIQEANIYDSDPSKLLEEYKEHAVDGKEWYFFTTRERKYPNGDRPRRDNGGTGYWKAAGKFKNIPDTDGKTHIGAKHTLDYYKWKQSDTKSEKTKIKMHEYVLETKDNSHAETKKRNEELSKDSNKKRGKKNNPHPDGKQPVNEKNPKPFHALALCKIWISNETSQKHNPTMPEVEAKPEPSLMKMDTAVTDEKMDTAMTDETFSQHMNEILQESGFNVLGGWEETWLSELWDPVPEPIINQMTGAFVEPIPGFGDNNLPVEGQNAVSLNQWNELSDSLSK